MATTNPIEAKTIQYAGFIRGLRRRYHGEQFGTQAEHDLWMSLADDQDDEQRAAKGRGYRDGLRVTVASEGQAEEEGQPKSKHPCIACDRPTGPSDHHFEGLALCLGCFEKVVRGGRSPRQTIEAVLFYHNDPDVGGPDDPLDHEDYRDLELLGLWPEEAYP